MKWLISKRKPGLGRHSGLVSWGNFIFKKWNHSIFILFELFLQEEHTLLLYFLVFCCKRVTEMICWYQKNLLPFFEEAEDLTNVSFIFTLFFYSDLNEGTLLKCVFTFTHVLSGCFLASCFRSEGWDLFIKLFLSSRWKFASEITGNKIHCASLYLLK